jgi:Ser/Thr protein kinase RdoA (MazF antagonist)
MSYEPAERVGFLSLTDEQVLYYESLARTALKHHDLRITEIDLLATHSNVTFRVSAGDGVYFALRVGSDPLDAVDLASELAFLTAVQRGTDIRVPIPVADREGRLVTDVTDRDGRKHHECVLFTWLAGTPVGAEVNASSYALMGEIAAKLHRFSRTWLPPADFRPLVWNDLFYYPRIPVLAFEGGDVSPLLPQWSHGDVRYLAARAVEELAVLDEMPGKRALHGNIEMWNVLVEHGRPGLLDFEEVMFGQPVHDIAITLHYGRSRPDYADLRHAFRAGYERISPWPVETDLQLDLLSAARGILFLNAALQREPVPHDFIERECSRLVELRRQTDIR